MNPKLLIRYINAFIFLICLSPLFVIIGIVIATTSKGPIFYKQRRIGKNGKPFNIYKFRTMIEKAENQLEQLEHLNEADGPAFKIKNDPRITFIGKYLRKTGLDELPQLFNIILGDMNFIGPRPPLPNEVENYQEWHKKRLEVKPGITCIWQVHDNRNDILFDEWVQMDIDYIENRNTLLDAQIIVKTLKVMVKANGR